VFPLGLFAVLRPYFVCGAVGLIMTASFNKLEQQLLYCPYLLPE
jgi:hypothetical protein